VSVNNDAVSLISPAEHTTLSEYRRFLDVNLVGPFLFAKPFGEKMLGARNGSIINVNFLAGLVGLRIGPPTMHQSTGLSV
jgi:NAD(P)-dependent dehydrogenase (short-subunit alcohol dehydrogenase family)